MNAQHTPGPKLSVPLMHLLMEAPEVAVFAVEDAIRAVAVGDWRKAAHMMSFAAEACDGPCEWFDRAGRASDELLAIHIAKATGSKA